MVWGSGWILLVERLLDDRQPFLPRFCPLIIDCKNRLLLFSFYDTIMPTGENVPRFWFCLISSTNLSKWLLIHLRR